MWKQCRSLCLAREATGSPFPRPSSYDAKVTRFLTLDFTNILVFNLLLVSKSLNSSYLVVAEPIQQVHGMFIGANVFKLSFYYYVGRFKQLLLWQKIDGVKLV